MADKNKSDTPHYSIDSVDSALRILRMLCDKKELRVSEVAEQLAVAQSTAHRLLSMLVYHGFAQQNERRGGYKAGPQFLHMGFAAIRDMEVRQYARPVLTNLRDRINETVHLALPYGRDVFYIDGVESRQHLRIGLRIGEFVPANCISIGKVMLATLSKEEFHRMFPSGELPALTPNSIATRDKLESQLSEIRRKGYARSRAESADGVGSVAMALLDSAGAARAAISVSAPLVRMTPKAEVQWIEAVRASVDELQARLWRISPVNN